MINQFKVVVGKTAYQSRVELNGTELKGVRRVAVDIDANKRGGTVLTIEVEGEGVIEGHFVEEHMSPVRLQGASVGDPN